MAAPFERFHCVSARPYSLHGKTPCAQKYAGMRTVLINGATTDQQRALAFHPFAAEQRAVAEAVVAAAER